MCPYCDYNSYENMIFKDPLTNEWYLKVMGTGWDYYNDDWQYENVYDIYYCPFLCDAESIELHLYSNYKFFKAYLGSWGTLPKTYSPHGTLALISQSRGLLNLRFLVRVQGVPPNIISILDKEG